MPSSVARELASPCTTKPVRSPRLARTATGSHREGTPSAYSYRCIHGRTCSLGFFLLHCERLRWRSSVRGPRRRPPGTLGRPVGGGRCERSFPLIPSWQFPIALQQKTPLRTDDGSHLSGAKCRSTFTEGWKKPLARSTSTRSNSSVGHNLEAGQGCVGRDRASVKPV
jgi:hypothetical protein